MHDDFIKGLIRLVAETDHSLHKALHAKTDREKRRQLMKAGANVQEVQRRLIEALK